MNLRPDAAPRDSFVESIEPTTAPVERIGSLAEEAFEQVRQAICVTGPDIDEPGPRIERVNRSYLDMFCMEADEVIGESPRFAQGPLTSRAVLDRIREHLVQGRALHAQAINYRSDRSTFRLRWSIDPIIRNGRVVNFVAFMTDVTIEDRLRRRLAALDTLLSEGRAAIDSPAASRNDLVANTLARAIAPMVAEIGRARVDLGGRVRDVVGFVANDVPWSKSVVEVRGHGTIALEIHPDAGGLVDKLAIDELAEYAGWMAGPTL